MRKPDQGMDRTIRAACRLIALAAMLASGLAVAGTPRLYLTWAPWQVDSVLAAWVIKRHVYPDADFGMVVRGAPIATAQAIDTPASPYRRNGMRTAFEETLRVHAVPEDACIGRLRSIVRVLELAAWRKVEWPDTERFELELLRMLPKEPSKGRLEPAFEYIDRFCASASGEKR